MRFLRRSRPYPPHVPHGRTIRRRDLRSFWIRAATIASAVVSYPAFLALFFWSGRIATGSPDAAARLAGWIGAAIFITLALALPVLGLAIACSHAAQPLSPSDLAIRRMAHLTWMAPPLYTATGVWLLILGLPGWTAWGLDAAVWVAFWPIAFATLVRAYRDPAREAHVRTSIPPTLLRVSHVVAAALLILAFIAAHLLNHVVGLLGFAADKAVMDDLRTWYRSDYVQPLIIAGFLFMMATGVCLARYRTATNADVFGTLQTMSGAYLAAFLFSHMSAILILARAEHGIDTDWRYAIGAPRSYFADPGNVRLIPHYLWVVVALTAHAACGLRGIMLEHGLGQASVDRTAWRIGAAGIVLSVVILSALLGARIR